MDISKKETSRVNDIANKIEQALKRYCYHRYIEKNLQTGIKVGVFAFLVIIKDKPYGASLMRDQLFDEKYINILITDFAFLIDIKEDNKNNYKLLRSLDFN